MEEHPRIAARLVVTDFEPSRNAAELLAFAYQRMLAISGNMVDLNSVQQTASALSAAHHLLEAVR